MPILLFFLLFSVILFGEEDSWTKRAKLLTSLDSEPSGIIDGCVNVISGCFFDYELDLTVPGPEPLTLERSLVNNNPHGMRQPEENAPKWAFNDCSEVLMWRTYAKDHMPNGFPTTFYGDLGEQIDFEFHLNPPPTGHRVHIDLEMIKQGQTNTSQGIIGAQTNIRNNQLMWNYPAGKAELRTSNGSLLTFTKGHWVTTENHIPVAPFAAYVLIDELKPNLLRKNFGNSNRHLKAWNGTLLSSIQKTDKGYQAPDGRTVEYNYIHSEIKLRGETKRHYCDLIESAIRSDKPSVHYAYTKGKIREGRHHDKYFEWPHLCRKSYPDNRFLTVDYYDANDCIPKKEDFKLKNVRADFCRVKRLGAPVGADAAPLQKYRFCYFIPPNDKTGGCTGVYDALNHKTDYGYNSRGRLTGIVKFYDGGAPYTTESLHWGPEDTHKEIELASRTFGLFNSPYKTFAKVYGYDVAGNIVEEKLYGNITGKSASLVVNEGIPVEGTSDCLRKCHAYSEDSLHLLLRTYEGTRCIIYTYVPETSLVSSCLHLANGGVYLRHFYFYDFTGMVIRHVMDDGSGNDYDDLTAVTMRKIEETERSSAYPYGLPLVEKELYLDLETGQECLGVKKIHAYNMQGRKISTDTYGNDGAFAYTVSFEYDTHGNITKEVNPKGHIVESTYDENDNLISQIGPNPLLNRKFHYDFMNRLVLSEEIHPDGILSKSFRYDLCGNLISKIDAMGNETKTAYDNFHRPIVVESAGILNVQGELYHPVTRYEYNELSHPIKITSPEGGVTYISYNIYGKPFKIIYPDGLIEQFEYDLEGKLIKEITKDGSQTFYTYDPQGRITKKQLINGEHVLTTESTYNAFHLLSETDVEGNITSYTYDAQGRKVSETKGDFVTYFEYDTLNRCTKTTITSHFFPDEGSVKVCIFDPLNQVIEERVENIQGETLTHVRYDYDAEGNKTHILQEGIHGTITSQTTYDTHGIPIESIDQEGNITRTKLVFGFINPQGQRVIRTETVDPLGQSTIVIKDAQGRLSEQIKRGSFGQEIKKTAYIHNTSGKCLKTIETIFHPDGSTKEVVNAWEYDLSDRPLTLIQALGTVDEKRLDNSYNSLGQLEAYTKPNGVALQFTYDLLGRLIEETATDSSIHYQFTYDMHSNPIQVDNLIDGTKSLKTYDIHSRIIEETLANDLQVELSYTPEGNIKKVILPDSSSIAYTYDGSLLKTVSRHNIEGDLSYQHSYCKYDQIGNAYDQQLIHNSGSLYSRHGPKGSIHSILSPCHKEDLRGGYDAAGNLLKRKYTDSISEQIDLFAYDELYQLKEESGHFNHVYTSDSLYNRCSKDGQNYTLNSLNQLISDGTSDYTYDACGNLIAYALSEKIYSLSYDALDRLKTLKIDSTSYEYTYDEQNRCITRKVTEKDQLPLLEKIFFIGQNDCGTADADGKIHSLRILGKGKGAEIGAAIAIEIQDKTYAPIHDYRGNVIALLDPEGKVQESYRYSAFGEEEIYNSLGKKIPESTLNNPWRFSSKRKEAGYSLFGRRFYSPELGRFLTPDPAGHEAGPNLYAFTNNSPLIHLDIYGFVGQKADSCGSFFDFAISAWNFLSSFFSWSFEKGKEGISCLGAGLQVAFDNIIPIPLIKDQGCLFGYVLETGGTAGFQMPSFTNYSDFYTMGLPELSDHVAFLFFNGICTSQQDALGNAGTISDAYGGYNIYLGYNGTNGFNGDIPESVAQKLGIMTPSVRTAIAALRYSIYKVGGPGSNGIVKVDAHSQGGLVVDCALQYLTAEEKSMICVSTYGSAKLIDPKGLKSCVNYVSTRDPIPLIGDPIGYLAAKLGLRSDVQFIKSKQRGLEHGFQCITYQEAMDKDAKDFKKLYIH